MATWSSGGMGNMRVTSFSAVSGLVCSTPAMKPT
jgi:hypothetical protein